MGTGKKPCPRPSCPIPSTLLLSPLTVAKCLFRGVFSIWLTLGAVLCDLCFGRSPSKSPSPVPSCQSQPGRGSPARKSEEGRCLISHTCSVNPNLFGVPYSAPLSPLRVPPRGVLASAAPAGSFHIPPLCPHPMVYGVDRGFERML